MRPILKRYLDIPLLKDVQPEDIEDVTERFVHMFTEERNSDIVKRVRIQGESNKGDKIPFYLISLIEHKSKVDYNVVMQVIRYMLVQLKDYSNARLMEKRNALYQSHDIVFIKYRKKLDGVTDTRKERIGK